VGEKPGLTNLFMSVVFRKSLLTNNEQPTTAPIIPQWFSLRRSVLGKSGSSLRSQELCSSEEQSEQNSMKIAIPKKYSRESLSESIV
jgi:hypothetical protein